MEYLALPDAVKQALVRLVQNGHRAVIVGGCVRDALLGDVPHDYDIATSATPDQVRTAFPDARVVPTGLRHGTVTLVLQGMALEVTTFRVERGYADGRHPDAVVFTGSLEADVRRRDFTVNALAYAPGEGVIDLVGGCADLAARRIRCVGEPEARFAEDALRILRALRFAARLDFEIEPETAAALRRLCGTLDRIARERVSAEICGLLMGRSAGPVLRSYWPVLAAAVPALNALKEDAAAEVPARVSAAPFSLPARLAALCRHAPDALLQLRLDGCTLRAAQALIEWAQTGMHTRAELCRALGELGPQLARDAVAMYDGNCKVLEALIAEGACCRVGQLAVNGRDLIEGGMSPGPELGKMLDVLLDQVLNGALPNERAALLGELARRMKRTARPEERTHPLSRI